jgi:hypothetical protein
MKIHAEGHDYANSAYKESLCGHSLQKSSQTTTDASLVTCSLCRRILSQTDPSVAKPLTLADRLANAEARVATLESLIRETYPMIVEDFCGIGIEITDFQFWKRRALLAVPLPTIPPPNPPPFSEVQP